MLCKGCFTPSDGKTTCATCSAPLHKECAVLRDGISYCDEHATIHVVTHKDVILPDTIRRSNIELYRKCAYAFYLHVIKGMEIPGNVYTQVGIDLHDLFNKASKDLSYSRKDMKEDFTILWDAYPKSFFTSDGLEDKMHTRAIDSIDAFYTLLPTFPAIPFATEQKIEFSIGDGLPTVNITMDRIDEVGDMLDIDDYKTGAVIVGKKISSDLQPPLYIKAVRDKYNRSVRRFRLLYLQEGKERVYERVDDENYTCVVRKREYHINITDAVKEVQRVFQHIKNADFNIPKDTKSMFFTCKMCHFKESGVCRGAEEEVWYQSKGDFKW